MEVLAKAKIRVLITSCSEEDQPELLKSIGFLWVGAELRVFQNAKYLWIRHHLALPPLPRLPRPRFRPAATFSLSEGRVLPVSGRRGALNTGRARPSDKSFRLKKSLSLTHMGAGTSLTYLTLYGYPYMSAEIPIVYQPSPYLPIPLPSPSPYSTLLPLHQKKSLSEGRARFR